MRKLCDLVPAGVNARREARGILTLCAFAALWSLTFLPRYFAARACLFFRDGDLVLLLPEARMPPFSEILDGALLGCAAAALLLPLLAAWHLLYHYLGSRSIDLMRRLPRKRELPLRCLALPLLGELGLGVLTLLLLGLYYALYRLCTPAAAL